VATKFAPPADDLRDKRLLSCRADEIVSLAFDVGGDSFTISRDAPGKPWKISPEIEGQALNKRLVDNAVNSLVLARADAVIGDAASDAELARWGLDKPLARLDVTGTNGPCASISGAALPAPPEDNPAAPARATMRQFAMKKAGRSAVLRASEHEFSRISMKRAAFVDTAKKPEAAAPAGDVPASAKPPVDPNELGTIVEPDAPR
jgi:hypothetical protein